MCVHAKAALSKKYRCHWLDLTSGMKVELRIPNGSYHCKNEGTRNKIHAIVLSKFMLKISWLS